MATGLLGIRAPFLAAGGHGSSGGGWRLRPARRPLVSVTAPGDGHSHSPGKDSRKQLAVCRAAQLGHHGETTKHKPKKSPRPSTAVHNLAGPQKMPDKGCFHFLQPLLRIFVRLKTPSPLQIVNSWGQPFCDHVWNSPTCSLVKITHKRKHYYFFPL